MGNREEAITAKIEQSAWINKRQIVIHDFYFTTNGGVIAWVNLGKVMVKLIHDRAIRAASKNFRTINCTSKIARDRRTSINKILRDFKKANPGFRYLIRNGHDDLTVLVKRASELHHMPYRNYHLKNLGQLSPLKPNTPLSEEEKMGEAASLVSEDGFTSPKSGRSDFLPKDEIFFRLKNFLDGFNFENDSRHVRGHQQKL